VIEQLNDGMLKSYDGQNN